VARDEAQAPGAGPHLGAQTTIRLQAGGNGSLERHGDEVLQQHGSQQHFSSGSGHPELDQRLEQQRHLVDHTPVHDGVQAAPALLLLALAPQPQETREVAIRKAHRLAQPNQRDQSRFPRDRDRLR
jgi:hypothetical protein